MGRSAGGEEVLVTVRKDPSLAGGTIELTLGSSFTALVPRAPRSRSPAAAPHRPAGSLAATDGGITSGATCKSDAGCIRRPAQPWWITRPHATAVGLYR
jgi:hypothetical protein